MSIPLGVLTRYDEMGASSRLRYYLFRNALENGGFRPEYHPFFRAAYLRRLYAGQGKSRLLAAGALLRRLALLPRLPERLLVEYELLPELSAACELKFLRRHRYILNFDDNVWEKYAAQPRLAGKYDELIRRADGVIAANDFLLERVAALNPNAIKIPTVVDLGAYDPAGVKKFPRFTVGWIGTPVTYSYLEQAAGALRTMSRAADFELLVIARRDLEARAIPGVRMRFADWSADAEAGLLLQCHAGIMPLTDDPFSRGKSAYKLIQYQAAGLPAIASPVGENVRVIRHGVTGFLADSPAEWADALKQLAADSGLCAAMGLAARAAAFDYSLQKYGPVEAAFLRSALSVSL